MKIGNSNPLPYVPQSPTERDLCAKVEALSGEVVLNVWTPSSYPHEDINGNQVLLEADFEVRTGRLSRGLFASGSVYRGHVRDGHIEIEFWGIWT